MNVLTLVPVVYRDYKSAAAVIVDFNAGKDFQVCDMSSKDDGRACTRGELSSAGVTQVRIRYNRLTKVTVIDVEPAMPQTPAGLDDEHALIAGDEMPAVGEQVGVGQQGVE